jgi:hypothetical protein
MDNSKSKRLERAMEVIMVIVFVLRTIYDCDGIRIGSASLGKNLLDLQAHKIF